MENGKVVRYGGVINVQVPTDNEIPTPREYLENPSWGEPPPAASELALMGHVDEFRLWREIYQIRI